MRSLPLLAALIVLALVPCAQAQSAAPAPARAEGAADWSDGAGVDIEVRPNLVYRTASGQDLKLDLYLPFDRHTPPPLVLFIHGGGWVGGSKEIATLRLLPYLKMGWAAANVQYRLAPVALAPAAVEDVRCALRYVTARAKEWKVDAERIVVSGGSAGGHLALMAGLLPNGNRFDRGCATEGRERWSSGAEPQLKVAAIVNWFGITDVNDLLAGPNAKHYAIEWFGPMPDEPRATLARDLSPLSHVRRGVPPVFSVHGSADDIVPPSHSERLHQALNAAGVINELLLVPGAGHGTNRAQAVDAARRIEAFLRRLGVNQP